MRGKLSDAVAAALFLAASGTSIAAEDSGAEIEDVPGQSASLEEVVVTAQKSEQTLQRAPAAISVLGGDALVQQGIVDLRGVSALVPSARFGVQNDSTQVFIRGIGSNIDAPWIPESVATNFDGAFLPRLVTGTTLYDTSRIEVLPGPQGTLYGRSAVGGVVNIYANRPTERTETDVLLEGGNVGYARATLVQNLALSDEFGVRAAFNGATNDGYNNNGTYSEESYAGRLNALYRPREDVHIYGWVSQFQNEPRISPTQYSPYPSGDAWEFPAVDSSTAMFYPPGGVDLSIGRGEYEATTAGAEVEWRVGDVALTYVPTYVRYRGEDIRPIAGFAQPLQSAIDQYSQELRLASTDEGRVNYLLGLYWLDNDTDHQYVFGPNFGGGKNPYRATTKAAYGQLTFAVTDSWRLTAGGRYAEDDVAAHNAEAYFPIFNPSTFQFDRGVVPFSFDKTWERFDWKIGFELDVGAASLLYANVQTGYNPGSYEATAIALNPTREIKPQKTIAYTAGLKNRFLDNRLQANVEAYFYDYTDLIVQQYDGSTGSTFLYNAPKTEIYGAQADVSMLLTQTSRLYANLGYLHSAIKELIVRGVDYEGFELPTAPKLTASFGLAKTWNFQSGASTTLRVDSYYNDGYWAQFDHPPDLHQDAFTKTDISLTWYAPNGRWDVGAWVKNIEDEAVIASSAVTGKPYPLAAAVYVEPPRTYGLRVHVRLGD